jgi:hypothetical protein
MSSNPTQARCTRYNIMWFCRLSLISRLKCDPWCWWISRQNKWLPPVGSLKYDHSMSIILDTFRPLVWKQVRVNSQNQFKPSFCTKNHCVKISERQRTLCIQMGKRWQQHIHTTIGFHYSPIKKKHRKSNTNICSLDWNSINWFLASEKYWFTFIFLITWVQ